MKEMSNKFMILTRRIIILEKRFWKTENGDWNKMDQFIEIK